MSEHLLVPFERFPGGGRKLLGRPLFGNGTARTGYGLGLQRMTGQTKCAYCGLSIVESFQNWLMLRVDHVVPGGEARRVGIPPLLYEDAINLVLCCSACNGFGNRFKCHLDCPLHWTTEDFCDLRDRTYEERFAKIEIRRRVELEHFEKSPWLS